MNNTAISKTRIFFLLLLCGLLLAACDTLMESFQQVDSQSATLTAMVSPTVIAPTLDLKGNQVIESEACTPLEVVCVSILEDRLNGGIMNWAADAPVFAYTAPQNRYWAWFSGDAVVLDFSADAAVEKYPDETAGEIIPPKEYSTTDIAVFGNFVFSPDHSKIAFTALRQSEKVYTVMVSDLDSGLGNTQDLFPGTTAETDSYSSDKSVIEWINDKELRAASSCGIDCEQIYRIDTETGLMTPEEETRKNGHKGRVREDHVIEYDDRDYPVMSQANWSPDEQYVFYRDNRYDVWILKDDVKEQFRLDTKGEDILQTLWSPDSRYIALRYEDKIKIYRVDCQ